MASTSSSNKLISGVTHKSSSLALTVSFFNYFKYYTGCLLMHYRLIVRRTASKTALQSILFEGSGQIQEVTTSFHFDFGDYMSTS